MYPSTYDFDGVVGFGKPIPNSYESTMATIVGEYWTQEKYAPVVTFDYNFGGSDSNVYVGAYKNLDNLVSNVTSYA